MKAKKGDQPKCRKCGNPARYYGPVGGYGVQCEGCNRHQSPQRRAAAARRLEKALKFMRERDLPHMKGPVCSCRCHRDGDEDHRECCFYLAARERDEAEAKFKEWSGTDVPALNIALKMARDEVERLRSAVGG